MDIRLVTDEPLCAYSSAPHAAARALVLLILGTVAGVGSVGLFVGWLVMR